MRGIVFLKFLVAIAVCVTMALAKNKNKYSKEANTPAGMDEPQSYSSMENPFRMRKINLVWEKARLHAKLTENKLKKLYSELKLLDKEELTLKKLKTEGGDKSGMKEAETRKKFGVVLKNYGLGGDWIEEEQSHHKHDPTHQIFKDKKLQKLWEKAEKSGLTPQELLVLQEEFLHHQEKVNEYHELLETMANKEDSSYNDIKNEIKEELMMNPNDLKKVSRAVKEGYNRLHKLATNQGEIPEFRNPKVLKLWSLALESNYDEEELESLKEELRHYEKKLEKLHFFEAELQMVDERKNWSAPDDEKTEGRKIMDRKLAKHIDGVTRLHEHLERKILVRHNEL